MAQHWGASPVSTGLACSGRGHGRRATRRHVMRIGAQNRVRMPIVPTIWFAVLDAPPDVLMNAW